MCDHFDEDRSGYVTIGDVWHIVPIAIVLFGLVYMYFFGLYLVFTGCEITGIFHPVIDCSILWFIGITIIVAFFFIVVLIVHCLRRIADIRIAVCKRGDIEDNKEWRR